MKVQLLVSRAERVNGRLRSYQPGDVIDVSDGEAERLISKNRAVLIDEQPATAKLSNDTDEKPEDKLSDVIDETPEETPEVIDEKLEDEPSEVVDEQVKEKKSTKKTKKSED